MLEQNAPYFRRKSTSTLKSHTIWCHRSPYTVTSDDEVHLPGDGERFLSTSHDGNLQRRDVS